jgi:hypothetical protein
VSGSVPVKKIPFETVAAALATVDPRVLLNSPSTEARNPMAGSLPVMSNSEVELGAGDIVIELSGGVSTGVSTNDTPRPSALFLRGAAPSRGWAVVANNHSTFAKEMEDAGWMLFFMAGKCEATAVRFDAADALRSAMTKLTRNARATQCNALEIAQIRRSRFLGLWRVSITVHLRHLQQGGALWQSQSGDARVKSGK